MNQFLHVDALEYAGAFTSAGPLELDEIEKRLQRLDARMESLTDQGKNIPSFLLAAYRGYEAAMIFKINPETFQVPFVVKLRDNQ